MQTTAKVYNLSAIRGAGTAAPFYHRGLEFIRRFQFVLHQLAELVNAPAAAILNGGGTLANESVAATLASLAGRGRGVLHM